MTCQTSAFQVDHVLARFSTHISQEHVKHMKTKLGALFSHLPSAGDMRRSEAELAPTPNNTMESDCKNEDLSRNIYVHKTLSNLPCQNHQVYMIIRFFHMQHKSNKFHHISKRMNKATHFNPAPSVAILSSALESTEGSGPALVSNAVCSAVSTAATKGSEGWEGISINPLAPRDHASCVTQTFGNFRLGRRMN